MCGLFLLFRLHIAAQRIFIPVAFSQLRFGCLDKVNFAQRITTKQSKEDITKYKHVDQPNSAHTPNSIATITQTYINILIENRILVTCHGWFDIFKPSELSGLPTLLRLQINKKKNILFEFNVIAKPILLNYHWRLGICAKLEIGCCPRFFTGWRKQKTKTKTKHKTKINRFLYRSNQWTAISKYLPLLLALR